MKKVAIVGYGRFGKVLHKLFENDFELTLYNRSPNKFNEHQEENGTTITSDIEDIYKCEVVFYTVSISSFEEVIKIHAPYITKNHLLIDALSVKEYPKNVFEKNLEPGFKAILSHPMFGPVSAKNGFDNLTIVLDKYTSTEAEYTFWKEYFAKKKLRVIEKTAEEHDKLAANSQAIVHLLGRVLDEYGYKETEIDTIGAKKLKEIVDITCNDTWELFTNLQNYNRYTKEMRTKLKATYDKIHDDILDDQLKGLDVFFGIQGGKGSFNEQAIFNFLKETNISNYKIEYLFTTEKVLSELTLGNIDYGLFAIHNSIAGVVQESIEAISKYKFRIIEELSILITHHLMKLPGTKTEDITTIMAHPHVLKQCKKTLAEKYPKLKLISGTDDLIDTAEAANALSKGKIDKKTAILGNIRISEIYDLEVIDNDLQDNKDNFTNFLLVKRH